MWMTISGLRLEERLRPIFIVMLSLSLLLGCFGSAPAASAHASLVQAVPAADSELVAAPPQVVLTFNERLEEGLYYLRVLDKDRKQVTEQKAVMSPDRLKLTLELPKLPNGTYMVTYRVVSADGHPVEGTYLFAAGVTLDQPSGSATPMEHLHRHGSDDPFRNAGWTDELSFLPRIAYYFVLLAFTGWLLWMRWLPRGVQTASKERLQGIGVRLQQAYLIVFIIWMWSQLFGLIGDGGREALLGLFTDTTLGYSWAAGLLLALLSFILLFRHPALDYAWVAMVFMSKATLGHAAAFEPVRETLILDVLHLAAASVWVGGLLMLLWLWSKDKEAARLLYPAFSKAALFSIVLLLVSGVLLVFIYLPDVSYVLETGWGQFLMAKTALLLIVIGTALWIRYSYRKGSEGSISALLRMDGVLAALIVVIVGIFTYLSPLPENKPLQWHVMGEKIHMTTQITPNVPGVNEFTVKVWLPEAMGKPKEVLLKLSEEGMKDVAPIMVPLQSIEDKTAEESYGMARHTYKAKGAYMPFPGHWRVEVRVMDSNDDETVYEQTMRLY
jgi:copper transport protein